MNPSAKNKLTRILSDNISGSTEILLRLVKWSKENQNNKETVSEMISIVSKELKTFSNVQSYIKKLDRILGSKYKFRIEDFLNEQYEKIKSRQENLFNIALPYLKNCNRIVTLSNSKTISGVLKKLNKHHRIYVIVGESRPKLEGRILAKELLKNKIKVEILTDALLTNAVEKSDAAVVGADTILSNGDVVNKSGSTGLALACNYFEKPFYVLATSDKYSKQKKYIPHSKDEKEIWNFKHKLLKRTNFYFEVVEQALISKIISDSKENFDQ